MALEQIATTQQCMPRHVGIIMDGNGRWAQLRKKPRVFGHKNGVEAVRQAVAFCRKNAIESLTLFAFSSENWQRPEEEVSTLMELFMMVLGQEVKKLHRNGVRLKIVGDLSRFSDKLQNKIAQAQAQTAQNDALTLNICANYGGRWDIAQAAKKLAIAYQQGEMALEDINEWRLNEQVCLCEQPPLDLLIRTGGDYRISNFLIWQAAYAELYFTQTLWPDFDEAEFQKAVSTFAERERRFGLTSEQIKQHQRSETVKQD